MWALSVVAACNVLSQPKPQTLPVTVSKGAYVQSLLLGNSTVLTVSNDTCVQDTTLNVYNFRVETLYFDGAHQQWERGRSIVSKGLPDLYECETLRVHTVVGAEPQGACSFVISDFDAEMPQYSCGKRVMYIHSPPPTTTHTTTQTSTETSTQTSTETSTQTSTETTTPTSTKTTQRPSQSPTQPFTTTNPDHVCSQALRDPSQSGQDIWECQADPNFVDVNDPTWAQGQCRKKDNNLMYCATREKCGDDCSGCASYFNCDHISDPCKTLDGDLRPGNAPCPSAWAFANGYQNLDNTVLGCEDPEDWLFFAERGNGFTEHQNEFPDKTDAPSLSSALFKKYCGTYGDATKDMCRILTAPPQKYPWYVSNSEWALCGVALPVSSDFPDDKVEQYRCIQYTLMMAQQPDLPDKDEFSTVQRLHFISARAAPAAPVTEGQIAYHPLCYQSCDEWPLGKPYVTMICRTTRKCRGNVPKTPQWSGLVPRQCRRKRRGVLVK